MLFLSSNWGPKTDAIILNFQLFNYFLSVLLTSQDVLIAGDLVPAHQSRVDDDGSTVPDIAGIAPDGAGGEVASELPAVTAPVPITTENANKITGPATTVTANANITTPDAASAEPAQLLNSPMHNTNIGLTLSGTSSTSGRGGSTMHTTPGIEHSVPTHTIPQYMRRKASDFTLRALLGNNYLGSGTESICNNSDKIGVNSNTTMYKNSLGFNAEADAKVVAKSGIVGTYANKLSTTDGNDEPKASTTSAATTGDQGLNNLFRNLQILSSAPIDAQSNTGSIINTPTSNNSTNNAVITPEMLSQQISEGVQRGVKEALGLMDTHRTHRTHYNTNPSPNDVLHQATHCVHPGSSVHVPHDKLNYDTRGLLHNTMNDAPSDIRKSLTLLKNKRSSRRGSQLNAGVRSTYYSNLPHCTNHTDYSNYDTNYIEHNHVPNRDICQPPRRKAIAQQQRQAEHKSIMEDILYSNANTHNMITGDENSSFNDSVSLDETTAAYLRDPLTYNMHDENMYQDNNSVVSSLDCDVGPQKAKNVKLMQRDVHAQKHQELFASTDNIPVKAHTTHKARYTSTINNNNTNTNNTSEDLQAFVPLVSRVLDQSATEDVLYKQLYARPAPTDSVDSASVYDKSGYGKNIDNDADNDARMWDLTASAPLVTFKTNESATNITKHKARDPEPATFATHTDGTLATMQLLSTKHYQQNEMKLNKSEDSFVSIGSSVEYSSTEDRSILTHSTNSTDISVADSQVGDANVAAGAATTTANTHPVSGSAPMYKRTSTTDINRANLVALSMNTSVNSLSSESTTNSRRVSMLPRYSPHKYNKTSKPTHTTRNTPANADTGNTERLAAHMMLNVLELHRPSNYTTAPYLSNPISSHLKRNGYPTSARSKIYATESVDTASSNSITDRRYTNNRYFNTDPDSDLDCTGSSISSAPDELLEHALYSKNVNSYSDTTNKPKSGLTLMGVGSNKLLRIHRK